MTHHAEVGRLLAGAFLAALLAAQAVGAQQLQLGVAKGPHYVGTFVEIEVPATGFPGEAVPELEVPAPASGRLDFVDLQRSSSQSITFVNGRMTRREEVRAVYRYRFVAAAPGRVALGPFVLSQGGVQRQSAPLQLQFREIERSDRLQVRLELPEGPIFVGQRVPIAVEFWLDAELQKNLHDYSLQVPLFDRTDKFRFVDAPPAAGATDVTIKTAQGKLSLSGSTREETRGGTKFLVVTVPRTMIASRSGTVDVGRASLIADEATRWQRDFFGGRRVTHVRKLRAVDRPRRVEVAAVPSVNRPESFAGAVGRGYSLEVSADRSVVQVGDPITLTLTVHGEGNLASAGFPLLSANGLLDPRKFRVPVGDLTGKVEGDTKRFTAVVRALSLDVREIPALEYTWFDSDTRAFQTTRSLPIALSVRAAKLVGADDVVSAAPSADPGPALRESGRELSKPGEAPTTASAVSDPRAVTALTGADLAIVRDVARLAMGSSSTVSAGVLLAVGYVAPCLLLGLSFVDRKRRSIDPAVIRLRKSLEVQHKRITAASSLSGRERAREFADALREMTALVPDARSPALDAFLGECDALVYAPGEVRSPTGGPSGEPLEERARGHARHIVEQVQ